MSEEDFDDDLQQIMDDLDSDPLVVKRTSQKAGLGDPPARPATSQPDSQEEGRRVKFEDKEEERGAKPLSNKSNLDKSDIMDDLFGSSKKEGKSSFLDDILGDTSPKKRESSAKKDGKSSFLDDILGDTSPKKRESSDKKDGKSSFLNNILGDSSPKKKTQPDKKDFVLDDKYKKAEKDFGFGDLGQNRRRRGNPTMGNTKPDIKEDIFADNPKTEVVPNEVKSNTTASTPFPWMTNPTGGFQQSPADHQPTVLPQPQPQLSQPLPIQQSNQTAPSPSAPPQPPPSSNSHLQTVNLPSVVESQTKELSQHLQSLYTNQNKVNQAHAEQGHKLLERVQQQFEEEVRTRQKMFMDQLEMMTKIQRDIPQQNVLEFFTNFPGAKKELTDEKIRNMMEEKVADIECLFKVKEDKLKENYEIIIKDLENKLGK